MVISIDEGIDILSFVNKLVSMVTVQIIIFQVFISNILNLSFKHNVPLFIIDPKFFRRIHNGSEEDKEKCHFLCPSQKVLHLATIGPVSSQLQKVGFFFYV